MYKQDIKIVTIGGGSSYTPELVEGFIDRYDELPVSEIWLVDIPAGKTKLETVGGLARRMVEKSGLDIKIETTTDRREALKDADYVTTQFRVGGLDARIRDERIPLKYGCIGQETTGAGGFTKALRTIPVILGLCLDMEDLCPDARLINFTNPSGIITETVLTHTKIKAIGLCNCPVGMQNDIAEKFGCTASEVYCDFVGLNHLLWAQKILVRDEDKTEEIVAHAHEYTEVMKNVPDINAGAEFYKSLGMLPIDYLKYYYLTKEMYEECLRASENEGVRGEVVKKVEEDLFGMYKDPGLKIKPPQLSERGGAHYSDAACNLICSIHNDKRDIQVVSVRNNGANLDLPQDVVIERNCVIGDEGAEPITLGHMPQDAVIERNRVNGTAGAEPISIGHMPLKIRGLVQLIKSYEQLTIQAGVFGDRDAALQALTIHPLVTSSTVAKDMLEELISANSEFLPQFA